MSHCACRCTVNAPSGCAASQDLQCVHVRNTQHSLPVQVEGYTRCDPCLASACVFLISTSGRTPSGTKRNGDNSGGHRGPAAVDIYDKCLGLTHLGVSSWKVVSGCTSRPFAHRRRHPLLLPVGQHGFGYENTKSGEGKKMTQKAV